MRSTLSPTSDFLLDLQALLRHHFFSIWHALFAPTINTHGRRKVVLSHCAEPAVQCPCLPSKHLSSGSSSTSSMRQIKTTFRLTLLHFRRRIDGFHLNYSMRYEYFRHRDIWLFIHHKFNNTSIDRTNRRGIDFNQQKGANCRLRCGCIFHIEKFIVLCIINACNLSLISFEIVQLISKSHFGSVLSIDNKRAMAL